MYPKRRSGAEMAVPATSRGMGECEEKATDDDIERYASN
jgi:hypothetical protein